MNSAMSGDAGNAETCTLLQRHALGDLNDLSDKNDGVLGGGSERTVGLSTITPYPPPNPFLRDSIAHRINSTRPIAMRNHTRIRHPYPKCVLAFLDIARIYTGKSDANSNPACWGCGSCILPTIRDILSSTLLLIACGPHVSFLSITRAGSSSSSCNGCLLESSMYSSAPTSLSTSRTGIG